MSKKKGSRGIPVDMSDFSEEPHEHGSGAYVLPRASGAPKALTLGDSFVLSSKPMSTKARIQAAEAEAARIIEKAKADAAEQAISDRLHKEYTKRHEPPKSVTCALCKKVKSVDDAIALGWKKHDFFANQAVCDACDTAHPLTVPKFVPNKPDMLSVRHTKLLKALDHAKTPPNALKAQVVASSALFEPLNPTQRLSNLQGMRHQLSAAFLTRPVAGIEPFTLIKTTELKKAINSRRKHGGTKSKPKTKTKTKSKSRSRSRSRAHR